MMLVNTTFSVELDVKDDWLTWIHDTYIAAALSHGLTDPLTLRILAPTEDDTINFAVQARGTEDLVESWLDGRQASLLASAAARWGKRVLHFTTIMEVVSR